MRQFDGCVFLHSHGWAGSGISIQRLMSVAISSLREGMSYYMLCKTMMSI